MDGEALVLQRTLVVDLGSRGTRLYQLGMMNQKSSLPQVVHGQPRECTESPDMPKSALSLRPPSLTKPVCDPKEKESHLRRGR